MIVIVVLIVALMMPLSDLESRSNAWLKKLSIELVILVMAGASAESR